MRQASSRDEDAAPDLVLDVLNRLWQTKLKSITVLEKWQGKAGDFAVKVGIKGQLEDERRYLRLLGEAIKERGGALKAGLNDQMISRPFAIVQAQPSDVYRLFSFHMGIKAFTSERIGHLIPYVDQKLARLLEQLAREEQRHVRWADMQLSHAVDAEQARQGGLLVNKVEVALDAAWSKSWRRLAELRYRSQTRGRL